MMENSTDFLSLLSEQQQEHIYENIKELENLREELEAVKFDYKTNVIELYVQWLTHIENAHISLSKKRDEVKHDMFVKLCLDPEGYKTGNGDVFACVVGSEKINDDNFVNISVVTPSMAYIDSLYYSSDNSEEIHNYVENERNKVFSYTYNSLMRNNYLIDEYRPFYYEFTAVLSDEELKQFNRQIKNLKKESNYKNENCFWFKAKLVDELLNAPGNYFGILNFGGSDSFSEGIVFTSLENVNEELREKLNDTYKISFSPNKHDCITYLNNFFNSLSQFRVKVFNVGQANCVYIENKKTAKRFFFDFGRPNDAYYDRISHIRVANPDVQPNSIVSKNLDIIKTLQHEFIIISHWHSDHFAAYKDLNKHGLGSTWIVPKIEIQKEIKSANRFFKYLVKNKANVFYLNSTGKIFDRNGIQLLSSKNAKKGDPNSRSLILRIRDTIFSADCLYEFWPDALGKNLSDVKRLVVPHHCSKMSENLSGQQKETGIFNSFSKTPLKEAYISKGFNTYHHPNPDHLVELRKASFDIFFTKNAIDYYEFDIT